MFVLHFLNVLFVFYSLLLFCLFLYRLSLISADFVLYHVFIVSFQFKIYIPDVAQIKFVYTGWWMREEEDEEEICLHEVGNEKCSLSDPRNENFPLHTFGFKPSLFSNHQRFFLLLFICSVFCLLNIFIYLFYFEFLCVCFFFLLNSARDREYYTQDGFIFVFV